MRSWEGIAEYVQATDDEESKKGQKWREQFMAYRPCSVCGGTRLKKEALQFRIGDKNIADVSAMSIADFAEWLSTSAQYFNPKEQKIAQEIVKEIRERLHFLRQVGLGYLSLSRSSRSLSGGESQRIRLATQIGSKLVNVHSRRAKHRTTSARQPSSYQYPQGATRCWQLGNCRRTR